MRRPKAARARLGPEPTGSEKRLIPPTELITLTGQKLTIDGLTFEFLLALDTEAPAEMHWYVEEIELTDEERAQLEAWARPHECPRAGGPLQDRVGCC
jgi:alkyl sulfatase BDS1-like metallo-beta-lactamase superfamily hydrolase